MAAEMVETTRLYARTAGPAKAEWVERLAEHLVKRTYSDEHWHREHARVEAFERVTLQGLVLVARRPIHYGPIEPQLSRAIFILHALVRGEYRTAAPFLRHNLQLVEQVQQIEAKARRRDVLVDEERRVKFYDALVPQRVYNGHEFEKWRRQAEKQRPKLLFMQRSDLMLHNAEGVTAELYPDVLNVEGVKVALEYRFDPGHVADGVTATPDRRGRPRRGGRHDKSSSCSRLPHRAVRPGHHPGHPTARRVAAQQTGVWRWDS